MLSSRCYLASPETLQAADWRFCSCDDAMLAGTPRSWGLSHERRGLGQGWGGGGRGQGAGRGQADSGEDRGKVVLKQVQNHHVQENESREYLEIALRADGPGGHPENEEVLLRDSENYSGGGDDVRGQEKSTDSPQLQTGRTERPSEPLCPPRDPPPRARAATHRQQRNNHPGVF